MFRRSNKIISLVLLITLILTALPPVQSALAAPAGVDGRILTKEQTGDDVNWVEIARSGSHSLIVRSSCLNWDETASYNNDPEYQHIPWSNSGAADYKNSLVYEKINAWFNGAAVGAGDNLPGGARLRRFTVVNDALNNPGSAGTSAGLQSGFSSPSAAKSGNGNDVAFALSFSEAANFLSRTNSVKGRNPATQNSNTVARANWEKVRIPLPDYGNEATHGIWLRSPGEETGTIGAITVDKEYRGRAFQMDQSRSTNNVYGYLYPALWVEQAIFQPDAPAAYTLNYNANGGSGAPGSHIGSANTSFTISSARPMRSSFIFLGWATDAQAQNPQYYPGSHIDMDSNITLYAVWTQVTNTLSYHANGGSGAPGSQTGAVNANLVVSNAAPTRTGFTFIGWSTEPTSASAQYFAGSRISMGSDKTLYAVWLQVTYTLNYHANVGSGAPDPQAAGINTNATISSVTPTRQGYAFQGWATVSSASGPQYYPGNLIYMDGNRTLYAIWKQYAQKQYTITYNIDGASDAPAAHTAFDNSFVNLSSTIPVRSGYTFAGWSTSLSAADAQYSAGQQVSINGNLNLYAVWHSDTQYAVTYHPNGGSGGQKAGFACAGSNYTIVSQGFYRAGYAFEGWSANPDGSGKLYNNNEVIKVDEDKNLYAKWGPIPEQDIIVCYYKNADNPSETIAITYLKTNSRHNIIDGNAAKRDGYTFAGWNSKRDGTGLSYTSGEALTVTEPLYIYAQWKAIPQPQYTITYDANDGSGAPDAQTAAAGYINLSSSIPAHAGYEFKGWSENQSETGAAYSAGQQINLNGSMTLYAVWKQITYTITYYANNGSGAPAAQAAYYGSNTLVGAAPTRPDYDFHGWTANPAAADASYPAGGQIMISNNVTLYAVWKQTTHIITYDANGGVGEPDPQKVAGADNLSGTRPTRNGYDFLGWSTDPAAEDALYSAGGQITVGSNETLYAVWKQVTYTVTYNANGGVGEPIRHTGPMSSINLSGTTPTRLGFSFTGWSESRSGTGTVYNAGQQIYLDKNILLYAVWSQNSFELEYNDNGGSGGPAAQTVLSNTNTIISCTAPTRSGYSFLGWSTDPEINHGLYLAGDLFNIGVEDRVLYAVWSPIPLFELSYDANSGTGAPGAQVVYKGEKATVSDAEPTRSGYEFQGWSSKPLAASAQYTGGAQITMNGDITLYAVWKQTTYTITYNANGGTGAPGVQTVVPGDVTISGTKPTRTGFTFRGWSLDESAASMQFKAGGKITISDKVTLYAVWEQITYTITYDANGGTGAPDGQTVTPGNAFLGSSIPTRPDFIFLGWAASKTATAAQFGAGAEVQVSSNVKMYAVWALKTYTVTYDANGGAGAPPQQTVNVGSAALSAAIPTRSNFSFVGWSTSQSATKADYKAGSSITVSGNMKLYAVWTQKSVITITYNANGGAGAPAAQTTFDGGLLKISEAKPTRSGQAFAGWNEDQEGKGRQYKWGEEYIFTKNTTLYAVWTTTTVHVLIYDATGGSWAPSAHMNTGVKQVRLDEQPAIRDGFTFLGWAKARDATVPYSNGEFGINRGTWEYPPLSNDVEPNSWRITTRTGEDGMVFDTTIYAIWNKADIVVIHEDKDTGAILRKDSFEIPIKNKNPNRPYPADTSGPYGSYEADDFDGYGKGVLAAKSDEPSGTIGRHTTKTITYLYSKYLLDTEKEAELTKTGANLSSTDGRIHVGDKIKYTITAENTGHPITVWADAVLTDKLLDGVTFAGNVTLNGTPLDENTDYNVRNGTLEIELGDIGGGENKVVTFEVVVNENAYGSDITNTAKVTGKNKNGEGGVAFVIEATENNGRNNNNGSGEGGDEGDDEETGGAGGGFNVVSRSGEPDIDDITVGDNTISGRGIHEAVIVVEFPNGITAETLADEYGYWIIDIPSEVPQLAANDEVKAYQTENYKESSKKVTKEVEARPDPGKQTSKTSVNLDRTYGNRVGDRLEYTITLKNTDKPKSIWENAAISDTLPDEVDFIADSVVIGGSAPSPGAIVNYNTETHTLTISNLGDIPDDNDIVVTFEVEINENAYNNGFKNTALVDGKAVVEEGDPTTVAARSAEPSISEVHEGDRTITGAGESGSLIEIVFPNTNDRGYGFIGDNGAWTVIVPTMVELKKNDVINAVQRETDLDPSLPAEAAVQDKEPVVPYIIKISENLTNSEGKTRVGDEILYTITAGNSGSLKSVWADVVVTDEMPVGLTLDESSVLVDGAAAQQFAYDPGSAILEVMIPDGIRGGRKVAITFIATVNEDAYELNGPIINTAFAVGNENGDSSISTDSAGTEEKGGGYIVAGKSDQPRINTITEGDKEITGNGAEGADIIVTLPDGTETNAKADSDGKWTAILPDGKEANKGNLFFAIQVDDDKDPSDPAGKVAVQRPDAVRIAEKTAENLTGSNDIRKVGDTLRYTITAQNSELKSLWENVTVTDALPEEVDFVAGSVRIDGTDAAAAAIYDERTRTLTIDLGSIPGGVTKKVTFDAVILNSAYGMSFTNTAVVDGQPVEESKSPEVQRRSMTLQIKEIIDGDSVVTGTGIPDAIIEVSFGDGSQIETAAVDEHGIWIVEVPDGTDLADGNKITAVQTEPGYDPSLPAEAIVKPKKPVVPYITISSYNLTGENGKPRVNDMLKYTIVVGNKETKSMWTDIVLTNELPGYVTYEGDVRLNGVLLKSGDYAFINNTLTVKLGDISDISYKVITFEVTVNPDAYGEEIGSAVSATGTDKGSGYDVTENTSEEGDITVVELSARPEVDRVFKGDSQITGKGVQGAEIIVTLNEDVEISTEVGKDSKWTAKLSGGKVLEIEDKLMVVQIEQGKDPGDAAAVKVRNPGSVIPELSKAGVNKTSNDGKTRVGDKIEYTITVKNADTDGSVWHKAVLTDEISEFVTLDEGSIIAGGDWTYDGGVLTVYLGDIEDNETVTVKFSVTVNEDAENQDITNSAAVSGKDREDNDVEENVREAGSNDSRIVEPEPEPEPEQQPEPEPGAFEQFEVNPVTEGDKEITGTGKPGLDITVTFPDGNTVTAQADEDGAWTVDVPDDITLDYGNEIIIVLSEDGEDIGEPIIVIVNEKDPGNPEPEPEPEPEPVPKPNPVYNPKPDNKSDLPAIDTVTVEDSIITGAGKPGSIITVTFPDGEKETAKVDKDGSWNVVVPDGVTLKPGDKITIVQTENGKKPSEPIVITVDESPVKPDNSYAGTISSENIGDLEIPLRFLEKGEHRIYIMGYTDRTVRPDSSITRAEVAMIFYRLLQNDYMSDNKGLSFRDVPEGAWYSKAIGTLAQLGIIQGYADGKFRPNDMISRAEFTAIAARFGELEYTEDVVFTDVTLSHWAAESIQSAFVKGWVDGYEEGLFRPEQNITRAEVTKIIDTMLGRLPAELPDNLINPFIDLKSTHIAYKNIIEASTGHTYLRDDDGKELWMTYSCQVTNDEHAHDADSCCE